MAHAYLAGEGSYNNLAKEYRADGAVHVPRWALHR